MRKTKPPTRDDLLKLIKRVVTEGMFTSETDVEISVDLFRRCEVITDSKGKLINRSREIVTI